MKKIAIALVFLLLFPCFVFAKYMAVLETLSPNDLLTRQEKLYLTDILRGQAVHILPAEQNWTIMTRENINVMLPPGKTIEECEGSCLAETGKNIAADYVAQARISQFGKSLAISAELYETASSKLISSFAGKGETVDDIEKIIKESAPSFFRKARDNALNGVGYVSTNNAFSFQGSKKFIVEVQTEPAGAIPTFDGKAYPQCTSTPCKIQLESGEHRLLVSKERFVDLDTLINVNENTQTIKLILTPNIGFVDVAPQISEEFKSISPVAVTINEKRANLGRNELVPGVYAVRISHICYDPIELNVALQKGETKEITDTLKRGVGALELDAVNNGEPLALPVIVNDSVMGTTPFSGVVPLCSKIEVEYDSVRREVPVSVKWHEVVKTTFDVNSQPVIEQPVEEPQQKADTAYAKVDSVKVPADTVKDTTATAASVPSAKRFWGGVTAGFIYNDFHSTHFGLNNIKHSSEYNVSVNGSDDLLSNFWGVGFKAGMSGLFIASPYFSVLGEFTLGLRQGTGETNLSVMVSRKDFESAQKQSDVKIVYNVKQLNIDIPVLARVSIPKVLYFEAGPMLSFNVYSKSKVDVSDIYGTQTFEQNGEFSAVEFDIATGLGVTRNIGKYILDFNLRFVIGLTRISDGEDSPKTWQGQLNATYWFL
ncbi:PEGA domain-containing protein [Fibrobacter sp. UWB11]|uniref:PEGA domain-containing protein n=1 Tax=Fibrobacter sp. UWB11 TaxID=1896202 RepID=UPI000926509B|nr:outer membrane beta-barrel protein [Fibrobacter sp. UWB11]SIO05115.1 PEGA domain-containing protein [Fibrobacter sp. UWB11]